MLDFLKKKKKVQEKSEPALKAENTTDEKTSSLSGDETSQAQPEEKDSASARIKRGRTYEENRIYRTELSERRAWNCAKGLGVVSILLAGALIAVLPLKEKVPYVIKVDNNTGLTDIVEIADTKSIPTGELMDKYWLANFIRSREGYDWQTVNSEFKKVRELSVPKVFEVYANQFKGNENLDKQMGPAYSYKTEISSVQLEPSNDETGIARVRFIKKKLNNQSNEVERESYWTATISYQYFPNMKMTEDRRMDNPFGFKVLTYRKDQEFSRAALEADNRKPTDVVRTTTPSERQIIVVTDKDHMEAIKRGELTLEEAQKEEQKKNEPERPKFIY